MLCLEFPVSLFGDGGGNESFVAWTTTDRIDEIEGQLAMASEVWPSCSGRNGNETGETSFGGAPFRYGNRRDGTPRDGAGRPPSNAQGGDQRLELPPSGRGSVPAHFCRHFAAGLVVRRHHRPPASDSRDGHLDSKLTVIGPPRQPPSDPIRDF